MKKLSLVPKQYFECLVPIINLKGKYDSKTIYDKFIAILNKESVDLPDHEIIGTGIIISYNRHIHVLTCYHVINKYKNVGILVRTKPTNDSLFIPISDIHREFGTNWVINEENDIALTLLIASNILNIRAVTSELFCPRDKLLSGMEIYYFGYPVEKVNEELFPAIRSGIISIAQYPKDHRILIDAMASDKNSGSAVFLKLKPFGIESGNYPSKTPFIGFIHKGQKTIVKHENNRYFFMAGLTYVISCDSIHEIFRLRNYKSHFDSYYPNKQKT